MTYIIDGKKTALEIREKLAKEAAKLKDSGVTPGLAVVIVGKNPASEVYVKMKKKACQKAGIDSLSHELPVDIQHDRLLSLIDNLNNNPKIHGILVQLPLPDHLDESEVINRILPEKDVDGFHPLNIGRLVLGEPCFKSCTPAGIMELIDSTGVDLKGKRAVVVGRSNIVGKPVSIMLLERHATLTVCHSRTADLPSEVKNADVLVAAIGKANFIKGEWIKDGAVVIDVGINRTDDGKIVGDVEFDKAKEHASFITPVPGGVGPMTIAMLLKNTVEAAKKIMDH